jgi:hypothetical protein
VIYHRAKEPGGEVRKVTVRMRPAVQPAQPRFGLPHFAAWAVLMESAKGRAPPAIHGGGSSGDEGKFGSLGWGRTSDISINSRTLYR